MIRTARPDEQDEEAKMQNLMFKINLFLFAGTIVAIRVGK